MLKSCEHGHDDMCVHFRKVFEFAKRKPFLQRSEVENFNRLMRYTSYKTFLDILEFRGMGIGSRY